MIYEADVLGKSRFNNHKEKLEDFTEIIMPLVFKTNEKKIE